MSYVQHARNGSANTDRGESGAIWADYPDELIRANPKLGFHLFEDFRDLATLVTPTITTEVLYLKGYKAFGSSGGTILPAAIEGGSGLVFTETDDNQGLSLAQIALPFQISRDDGKFWFEARLKTNSVADTDHGFFLGLMDAVTLTATDPIAAAGTLADHNFVGFHRLEGDGDQIDTVYKANGVTQVSVQTDSIPTGQTLAADTYFKLGMKWDQEGGKLSWYFNGLRMATQYTMVAAAGTDFPNDVRMGLIFAMLCASNNDAIVTIDWWRAAQQYL